MLGRKSEKTKIAWPNPAVYLKEEQAQKKKNEKHMAFLDLIRFNSKKSEKIL